jgi:hypothetical protein
LESGFPESEFRETNMASVSFSFLGSWFQEIEYNSVIVRSSVAWNFYASIRLINLKKKITITKKIFMKFKKNTRS